MKSSYGDNADEMIDAWIQAQVSGRGIEATDAGAEVLAMLGPFGTQLDALARKTGSVLLEDSKSRDQRELYTVTIHSLVDRRDYETWQNHPAQTIHCAPHLVRAHHS